MAVDKLVDSTQIDADLTSIANAIRTKGGTSGSLAFPSGFVSAVQAIPTGITPTGTKQISITANGTTTEDVAAYANAEITVDVQGGGTEEAPLNDVNFIDYDGTIVYSYSAADFAALTEMPANPTHSGLTAQGWNWTLADAKTHVASYGCLDIGQLYAPTDGKTKLYIRVDSLLRADRYIKLQSSVVGALTLDWGDGSASVTNTSTSEATYNHTYSSIGNYVIKISVSSGTLSLGGKVMLGTSNCYWSSGSLYAAEIGENVVLKSDCFNNHYSLKTITLPTSASYNTGHTLFNETGLVALTLPAPYGTTSTGGVSYNNCRAICFANQAKIQASWSSLRSRVLKRLCIPVQFTGNQGFNDAQSLERLFLSTDGTQIYTQTFTSLQSLPKLTIPSSITTIANNAIANSYSLKEVHMLGATPPTLSGTNNFTNHPADFVIYVPYSADHSVLDAYKTASNWSSFASYMQEEPQ